MSADRIAALEGVLKSDLQSLKVASQQIAAAKAEAERYRHALIEIDIYLAHDPQVWRIASVAKAGDVLCDVLGRDVIASINGSARCSTCGRS